MGLFLGEAGVRKGTIQILSQPVPFQHDPIEVIERKGIGHPDTICDALACELSIQYAKYTLAHCDGLILHHHLDKVLLVGGNNEVTFGEMGRFTEPIRIIVAGRASTHYKGRTLPVKPLIDETIKTYMARHFPIPNIEKDLVIEQRLTNAAGPGTLKESSGPIAEKFMPSDETKVRGYGSHYVSNDTSYCVAYAPNSPLEQAILAAEAYLNAAEIKEQYPWLGTDIKLMGVRVRDQIHLTSCIPQIARYVKDLAAYKANLQIAGDLLRGCLLDFFDQDQIYLSLNTKDNYQEHNVYVTVTGASLAGDVGVSGRANRTNGLITANRPMGLEGASGKNPRYFSGIVYNMSAKQMAQRLYEATGQPNIVHIVSQNGAPLLDPWHTIVTIDCDDHDLIEKIIREEQTRMPELTDAFIRGEIRLY